MLRAQPYSVLPQLRPLSTLAQTARHPPPPSALPCSLATAIPAVPPRPPPTSARPHPRRCPRCLGSPLGASAPLACSARAPPRSGVLAPSRFSDPNHTPILLQPPPLYPRPLPSAPTLSLPFPPRALSSPLGLPGSSCCDGKCKPRSNINGQWGCTGGKLAGEALLPFPYHKARPPSPFINRHLTRWRTAVQD